MLDKERMRMLKSKGGHGIFLRKKEGGESIPFKVCKASWFWRDKKKFQIRRFEKVRYFTLVCVCQGMPLSRSLNILKSRPMEHKVPKERINNLLGFDGEFYLTHVMLEPTHALNAVKLRHINCHKKLDEPMK